MAVRRLAEEQPASFEFTPENLAWVKGKIGDYPEGRQASAVIPILWRAQAQNHGWLPEPAIRVVADMLDMPYIRVFEIATFYTMFQLKPVGSVAHIGVCGTTPCMLRGSDDIIKVCKSRIAPAPFELSEDGRFSWEEVECAGACVNAPMVQIGPDTYEDLTEESFAALLDALDRGIAVTPGPQSDRKGSEPITGATTLTSRKKDAHPSEPPVDQADTLPNRDKDPTNGSGGTKDQFHGYPDPRGRSETAAMRTPDETPSRDPSPVAPEPETSGQLQQRGDAPAKQKAADAPGQRPEPSTPSEERPGEPSAPAREDDSGDETGQPRPAPMPTPVEPEPSVEGPSSSPPTEEPAASDEAGEPAVSTLGGGTTTEGGPSQGAAAANENDSADAPAAVLGDTPKPEARGGAVEDAAGGAQDDAAKAEPPDTAAAGRADQIGQRPAALSREETTPDDLQRINGVGPVIERTLHDLGIFTFDQIANWTQGNKDWVNAYLAFKGRIDREKWVEQAQMIVDEGRAED